MLYAQRFVVAFFIFFVLYLTYTYSGFVTKLTLSAVTRIEHGSVVRITQVFDPEKCFIAFRMPLLNFSKTLLQVYKRDNDLMQKWFSDTLISARPLRGRHNHHLSGLGVNTIHGVLAGGNA